MKKSKLKILFLLVTSYLLLVTPVFGDSSQLGASMYIAPLSENPKASNNFTATLKVDSLAQPVNAIRGILAFNKDKIEIINVSKIGSILNLWVEEPSFSNINGTLKFQGGVPKPGFIGNGGVILHIIFRAKNPGVNSLVWKEGEVLASDGKGTNILTNLQNLDFFIEEAAAPSSPLSFLNKFLISSNITLLIIALITGSFFFVKLIIRLHDKKYHRGKHDHNI